MTAIQDVAKTIATATGTAGGSTQGIGAVEDRFLKLLVTQMKNQDPLNPLDNAQVTSQLAQINTVNGIEKLNETLKEMSASILAGQSMQSASLLGRTVVADGNKLNLVAGTPARAGVQLDRAADSVKLTITGPAGNTVRQIELGRRAAGLVAFEWDGRNDAGATMAPGSYTFQVEAVAAGQKVASTPVSTGTVSGVMPGSGATRITVDGIGELNMQQIRTIR